MGNFWPRLQGRMKKQFDITTKAGILETLKHMDSDPTMKATINPISRYVIKKVAETLESVLKTTESTLQEQRQTAIDIIKAGKESGAQSVEVTLDQQVGLNFGGNVEGFPIKATMGKSGNMTIKVTYK